MDRKSKIWQIVLLVLLIAAIVAIVLFNNRLNTSNTALSAAQEQLAEAQKSSSDLQAKLDETQASYDEVSAKLTSDAEAADAEIKALQEQLSAAESEAQASADKAQELETAVNDSAAAIEALNQQIADAAAEADARTEADSKQVEALQAEIAGHEATIEALNQQIAERDAQMTEAASDPGAALLNQIDAILADESLDEDKLDELEALRDEIAEYQSILGSLDQPASEDSSLPANVVDNEAAHDALDLIEALRSTDDADEIQENIAALQSALDVYTEQLAADEAQSEEDKALLSDIRSDLDDTLESYGALAAEAQESREAVEALNDQIEALNAQSDADAEQLSQLNDQLAEATRVFEEKTAALEQSQEEYEVALENVEEVLVYLSEDDEDEDDEDPQSLLDDADALQEQLDALLGDAVSDDELEALKLQLGDYIDQLETAADQYSEAEARLEVADATLAEMQDKLTQAEANTTALTAELEEKRDTIDELNSQIEALNAQSNADAEQLDQLNAQLAEAVKDAEDKAEELQASQKEYEMQLAEIEAYKLSRDLTEGDALTATSVHDTIEVDADGVSAQWHYDNTAISAKDVVLSLRMDDEVLYTSDTLKPGESIDAITLNRALTSGQYDAIAVTSVYGDDGELQFTNRVPVTLNVK